MPSTAPTAPTATPAAAFAAARRRYLAGERIDMRALASELGVSRATLYRWTGPREGEEEAAGNFHPRADPDTLAYAVVRVTEGFIYNDAIAAVEPAVEEAAAIVSLLLAS